MSARGRLAVRFIAYKIATAVLTALMWLSAILFVLTVAVFAALVVFS